MTATDLTLALNPEQREAAEHLTGPMLVLAGAGSGKTRVLTTRIAMLIERHGVAADRIFAVTFTNRAAGEMKERIRGMLDRDPTGLWIGTFHSLSARLLRREAERIGFSRQFTIYDEDDRLSLIKRIMDQRDHPTKLFPPKLVQSDHFRRQEPDADGRRPRRLEQRSAHSGGGGRVRGHDRRAQDPERDGLRRPDAPSPEALPRASGRPGPLPAEVRVRAGRRVPGHQPGPVPAGQVAGLARQRVRGGRRRPVDLRLAGRRSSEHARLPARLRRVEDGPAGGELPEHSGGARRGQCGDCPERGPDRQDASDPPEGRRAG